MSQFPPPPPPPPPGPPPPGPPGGPSGYGVPGPQVPSYLVQAILCTLFCCLPAGVVAIVFAAQVNSKLRDGDYAGALESSNKARTWSWVSFAVGIVVLVIYGVLIVSTANTTNP